MREHQTPPCPLPPKANRALNLDVRLRASTNKGRVKLAGAGFWLAVCVSDLCPALYLQDDERLHDYNVQERVDAFVEVTKEWASWCSPI